MERRVIIGGRTAGGFCEVAVRLGHQHQIGQFHHAALDALQIVATARADQQHEHIDHVGDGHFRLADADRLDQNDIEARGLDQSIASRVRRATPPRVVPAGDGRMKALGSRASRSMRVLSPRIEPPERAMTDPRRAPRPSCRSPSDARRTLR
jgi:hypothetical protein